MRGPTSCWPTWRRSIPVETYVVLMHDVDRAVIDGEDEGFVKIHVRGGTDRVIGATIVARHAGEMISEISLAIRLGLGMRDLAQVIHAYPTQAGAVNLAASAYARDHILRSKKQFEEAKLAKAAKARVRECPSVLPSPSVESRRYVYSLDGVSSVRREQWPIGH